MTEQPVPGSIKPSNAAVANAVRDLVALVYERVPQPFSGPTDAWKLFGTAMIAMMADTVESVLVLMGAARNVDGAVLVRVLYEAVVKFCWISIDPDTNYPRWQEDSQYWEHRFRRDLCDYELERATEEVLAEYATARQMPTIPDMTIAADKYWGDRIVGFQPYSQGRAGIFTLRGYYAPVYRTLSEAVHARPETLARSQHRHIGTVAGDQQCLREERDGKGPRKRVRDRAVPEVPCARVPVFMAPSAAGSRRRQLGSWAPGSRGRPPASRRPGSVLGVAAD